MKPESQRIAIAEACGWICINGPFGNMPHPDNDIRATLPDYLTDLNAMHEAEKVLTEDQWKDYICNLHGRDMSWSGGMAMLHATAAEKAEAFLKAKNLWENRE